MKIQHMLVGLLACVFLSGCAHDRSKSTNSNVSKPDNGTLAGQTATFTVDATNGAPLSYRWVFNGTNISGVTNR